MIVNIPSKYQLLCPMPLLALVSMWLIHVDSSPCFSGVAIPECREQRARSCVAGVKNRSRGEFRESVAIRACSEQLNSGVFFRTKSSQ